MAGSTFCIVILFLQLCMYGLPRYPKDSKRDCHRSKSDYAKCRIWHRSNMWYGESVCGVLVERVGEESLCMEISILQVKLMATTAVAVFYRRVAKVRNGCG